MQASFSDSTLRIVFQGDLLSTNVDTLRRGILASLSSQPSTRSIVADLQNTRVVDSKGINLLIAIFRECQGRGFSFAVENPSADIRRLLSMLNLEERFGLKTLV